MKLQETSLWIGALLKERLEGILPVYPVVAANGAPPSFCVYRRAGYQPESTKDGVYSESVTLLLSVVTPTHHEGLEKAGAVIEKLDGLRGRWRDVTVERMRLTDATEEYSENAYVQHLYFQLAISD